MSPRFLGDPRFELKRSKIQVQLRMDAENSDADSKAFVAQFSEKIPREIIKKAERDSGPARLHHVPRGESVVITVETKDPGEAAKTIGSFMESLDKAFAGSLRSLEEFAEAFESEFERILGRE